MGSGHQRLLAADLERDGGLEVLAASDLDLPCIVISGTIEEEAAVDARTGTTFKLYLPVASSPHVEVPTKRTQASADLAGIETILVVADADSLRLLSERILKRYGYTVLVAANGHEAQRVCADHPDPIHVVLTDVIMPGGSGRSIADWITRHRPETKIIYMSGYTDNAIVHGPTVTHAVGVEPLGRQGGCRHPRSRTVLPEDVANAAPRETGTPMIPKEWHAGPRRSMRTRFNDVCGGQPTAAVG